MGFENRQRSPSLVDPTQTAEGLHPEGSVAWVGTPRRADLDGATPRIECFLLATECR